MGDIAVDSERPRVATNHTILKMESYWKREQWGRLVDVPDTVMSCSGFFYCKRRHHHTLFFLNRRTTRAANHSVTAEQKKPTQLWCKYAACALIIIASRTTQTKKIKTCKNVKLSFYKGINILTRLGEQKTEALKEGLLWTAGCSSLPFLDISGLHNLCRFAGNRTLKFIYKAAWSASHHWKKCWSSRLLTDLIPELMYSTFPCSEFPIALQLTPVNISEV